jgi:hypothetical protein
MSILRSYFSRNNTIISNLYTNTARNPVVELNFGFSELIVPNYGYTRFIFDLDLTYLQQQIPSGVISTWFHNRNDSYTQYGEYIVF